MGISPIIHTQTILLDGNIYDKLANDAWARSLINHLSHGQAIRIIATPKVKDELEKSPFLGIPDWFPVDLEPEAVTVWGHARFGMTKLGDGEVYRKHRGASSKIEDAIIADSAHSLADVLVSEDRRCRGRLKKISKRCLAMTYKRFTTWLKQFEVASG